MRGRQDDWGRKGLSLLCPPSVGTGSPDPGAHFMKVAVSPKNNQVPTVYGSI